MNHQGRLIGKFLPEEWKFWRVLRKGLGLGRGGVCREIGEQVLGEQ